MFLGSHSPSATQTLIICFLGLCNNFLFHLPACPLFPILCEVKIFEPITSTIWPKFAWWGKREPCYSDFPGLCEGEGGPFLIHLHIFSVCQKAQLSVCLTVCAEWMNERTGGNSLTLHAPLRLSLIPGRMNSSYSKQNLLVQHLLAHITKILLKEGDPEGARCQMSLRTGCTLFIHSKTDHALCHLKTLRHPMFRYLFSFILLLVDIQFSHHHLLKRPSFPLLCQ